MTEHYDLIVIGSGPGGASLAHRLAPTGKRILILERGASTAPHSPDWIESARSRAGNSLVFQHNRP